MHMNVSIDLFREDMFRKISFSQMSIDQGKASGCQLVLVTVSNKLSSRIFTALGFETRYSVDVSTLTSDWGLDLSAMKGNTVIHIMTKSLQ